MRIWGRKSTPYTHVGGAQNGIAGIVTAVKMGQQHSQPQLLLHEDGSSETARLPGMTAIRLTIAAISPTTAVIAVASPEAAPIADHDDQYSGPIALIADSSTREPMMQSCSPHISISYHAGTSSTPSWVSHYVSQVDCPMMIEISECGWIRVYIAGCSVVHMTIGLLGILLGGEQAVLTRGLSVK